MKITVAERLDNQPVGKVARIKDGAIKVGFESKHPNHYRVLDLHHPRDLAKLVGSLGSAALIVAGVPKNGDTDGVINPKAYASESSIALSDGAFEWPSGPGMLILDHDTKGVDEGSRPELNLTMDAFCECIEAVVPDLLSSYARWPSSSSCISGEGVEPRGVRGFHYGVFVADASDVKRAGDVLFKRLVIARYGYGFVTKTGSVKIRTIVDAMVWRPSHKIFAGDVFTLNGLVQDRLAFIENTKSSTPAETVTLLPALSEAEMNLYEAECQRLIVAAGPLSEAHAATYVAANVGKRARSIAKRRNVSEADSILMAVRQIESELKTNKLSGDAEIVTRRGSVTVDEILADPATWDGQDCADPFEPEYGSGIGVAKIYLSGGRANINSFAHGMRTYTLRSSPDSDFGQFGGDPGVAQESHMTETSTDASIAADSFGVRSIADLLGQDLPPVQWVVEGLLPRGCYLFGGKPKVGKSWLMLSLLLSVATGFNFLGRKIEREDCLYLALEDSDRRMQARVKSLISFDDSDLYRGFQYHTQWPKGQIGVDRLAEYLKENPKVKVVVIDTLARVKPPGGKNTNAYESDYAALAPYQSIGNSYGVTVILVTHLKKQPSADPFDDITGSLGQAGAVDGMLVLERAKTGSKQLILRGRGRDLDGDWELLIERDKAGQFFDRGSPTAAVAEDSSRGEVMTLLERVRSAGMSAAEVHDALPARKSLSSTRNLLNRMTEAGQVEKRNGRYYEPLLGEPEDVDDDSVVTSSRSD